MFSRWWWCRMLWFEDFRVWGFWVRVRVWKFRVWDFRVRARVWKSKAWDFMVRV
jgi:hypothetical protein